MASSGAVAIVGGGLAGLFAARELAKSGFSVTLFDKGRRLGGRLSTRPHGDLRFDHGAQYFTARDPRFLQEVERWVEEGVVARWDGAIAEVSSGTVVPKAHSVDRFVGVPGMGSLAAAVANETSGLGAELVAETRVEEVERSGDLWRLADTEGTALGEFSAVILTTPPEQMLDWLAGAPELRRQVSQVEMLPCWAAMLAFDRDLHLPFDGAFATDSRLSWIARDSSKPGRSEGHRWVLHASPEASFERLAASRDEMVDELAAAFFAAAGIPPVAPIFARAHLWRYALAKEPLSVGALWDPDLVLAVCGDWCHGSRVEGAALSGRAAAEKLKSAGL